MNALFSAFLISITTLPTFIHTNTEVLLKPIGTLYFYDNEHVIKFEEDLNAYYKNADLLHNVTMLMEEICIQSPHLPNCNYFKTELKSITEMAIKETQYFKLKHNKRELLCLMVSILAATIATAIATFFIGAAVATSVNQDLAEQQNIQHNTTLEYLGYNMDSINLQKFSMNAQFEDILALRTNVTELEFMNHLMLTSLFAAEKHNKNTNKYLKALSNNLKEDFILNYRYIYIQ